MNNSCTRQKRKYLRPLTSWLIVHLTLSYACSTVTKEFLLRHQVYFKTHVCG